MSEANEQSGAPRVESGLALTLMPVLLHKLNNATQFVSGLSTLLSLFPGVEGSEGVVDLPGGDPSSGLADASQRVDDLGWALAVLATAEGADLLLERREPRGIDIFLWLLSEAMGKRGIKLLPRESGWLIRPQALDGWQVAWGIAAFLHASSEPLGSSNSGKEMLEFAWSLRAGADGALVIEAPLIDQAAADEVLRWMPGASLEEVSGAGRLTLPAAWVEHSVAAPSEG